MRVALKLQLILLTILLVSITVFGSSYFFTRQEKEVLLREMTRRGVTIARNLAVISTDPMISRDTLTLATFVDSVMKNDGVLYGMILNEKGIILAHTRMDQVGRTYLEPTGVRPLTNEEMLIQSFQNDSKETVMDIVLPIVLRNGTRIGTAHIGMSQKAIDQLVNQAFRESLSVAAGLLLIAILISVFFTSMMLKPVEGLLQGVKAISQGDLNYQIRVRGARELRILAKAFNEMTRHLKGLYVGTLRAMAKALESRDKFAGGHDARVADFATLCAQQLQLGSEEVENIRLAAQVQNLGHIAVPDAILDKTGKLTPEEYNRLKDHVRVGVEIISQVPALKGIVPLVLHHHERFDGKGYPRGLTGKNIPLGARILAVADAFDAMISVQKHRETISREQALNELKQGAGTQFDPEIVDVFIEAIMTASGGASV